jgi:hypothetical protein
MAAKDTRYRHEGKRLIQILMHDRTGVFAKKQIDAFANLCVLGTDKFFYGGVEIPCIALRGSGNVPRVAR